jgi:hypothetical protein
MSLLLVGACLTSPDAADRAAMKRADGRQHRRRPATRRVRRDGTRRALKITTTVIHCHRSAHCDEPNAQDHSRQAAVSRDILFGWHGRFAAALVYNGASSGGGVANIKVYSVTRRSECSRPVLHAVLRTPLTFELALLLFSPCTAATQKSSRTLRRSRRLNYSHLGYVNRDSCISNDIA